MSVMEKNSTCMSLINVFGVHDDQSVCVFVCVRPRPLANENRMAYSAENMPFSPLITLYTINNHIFMRW